MSLWLFLFLSLSYLPPLLTLYDAYCISLLLSPTLPVFLSFSFFSDHPSVSEALSLEISPSISVNHHFSLYLQFFFLSPSLSLQLRSDILKTHIREQLGTIQQSILSATGCSPNRKKKDHFPVKQLFIFHRQKLSIFPPKKFPFFSRQK
jgi:hypothetical protein